MDSVSKIAWWLVVLGAVNWGLDALNFNVVELILGGWPQLAQIVYLLVGVSGVYYLLTALGGGSGKKKR